MTGRKQSGREAVYEAALRQALDDLPMALARVETAREHERAIRGRIDDLTRLARSLLAKVPKDRQSDYKDRLPSARRRKSKEPA